MTVWQLAALVMIAALVPPLVTCLRGSAAAALAAFEVASTIAVALLAVLSQAFQRQPFIDLALTLAFMSVTGALMFARVMERDL